MESSAQSLRTENTNSFYDQKPWLKKYLPEVRPHLDYPNEPLTYFLESAVKEFPHKTATVFFDGKLTYAQLWQDVQKFATFLASRGVQKGDRVGIMLPNCPQGVIAYYGTLLIGAVVVQFNPLYVEREIEYQLNDSGCVAMVIWDVLYPRLENVGDKTPLKTVVTTGLQEYMGIPTKWLFPLKLKKEGKAVKILSKPGLFSWKEVMATTAPNPPKVDIEPGDLCLIQYTGGTTGVPKGAMLSHRNLVANTLQVIEYMSVGVRGEERILCVLPFFHVYGMTVAMNVGLALAGQLLILPKFEVEMALKVIKKYRPTLFPGTPTMYVAVNSYPKIQDYDLKSIKFCLSGASALPVEVAQTFERLTGGNLVEGYGLTEASPVTHCNPLPKEMRKVGTIGFPLPDTEARIIDLVTGKDVEVGEIGELAIRGPQVMLGYWNKPEATAEAFLDGWLLTGDIAKMDEEGYFTIVDRKKDMIIAGGFNIYPREVEEVLYQHPAVKEAAVVGVPDEYRGETVKAFIVLKEGHTVTEEEIIQYTRTKLAAYKIPRQIEFRDELPKTTVGKVLRRKLKEESQNVS